MKPLKSYADVKQIKKPKARVPVKKRNAKRKGQRFPDEGRREPNYLEWLRTQKCVLTGNRTGDFNSAMKRVVQIVPAHNPSRGAGGRDADALPLEDWLHDKQHRVGIKTFCMVHRLDWAAEVVKHRARYIDQTE